MAEIRAAKSTEDDARIKVEWKLKPEQLPQQSARDLRPVVTASGILSTEEISTTDFSNDVTSLTNLIASRKYASLQVITAFCKRAAIGQRVCNSLTEIVFDRALTKARTLDEHFQMSGKSFEPFNEMAITLKECFYVKEFDSTNGYIKGAFKPADKDSPLVELFESLEVVVIAKTSVTQTI